MVKKYSVMIEGKNLCLERGGLKKMGFFTTRWVEAVSAKEAERIAIGHVKNELMELGVLRNAAEDPPTFVIEKTREVVSFGDNIVPGRGFTLFEED